MLHYKRRCAGGFTLVEMMLVMAVVAFLSSLGFVGVRHLRHRGNLAASAAMVQAVAASIAVYPQREWRWREAAGSRLAYIWDVNSDGLIDGDPLRDSDGPSHRAGAPSFPVAAGSALAVSGYGGYVTMVQPSIRSQFVGASRQPIDAWKSPLRIAYAINVYGSSWFGVWSAGPDRLDSTADDLCSWRIDVDR